MCKDFLVDYCLYFIYNTLADRCADRKVVCALKKKIIIVPILAFAILSGLWYAFFYKGDADETTVARETPSVCVPSVSPTVTPKSYIKVHVCGSVREAGVVCVEKGSRVVTAIEAAGGFSETADREWLNLARIVTDGERIYVPSSGETALLSVKDRIDGTGLDTGDGENRNNILININTAGTEALTTLPGIGESRAKDIIAYRTRVGLFEKTEDIKNVSGIGDSMYLRIKDLICVE